MNLQKSNKSTLKGIKSVFLKEVRSEFRTRYVITSLLLFILTTVSIIVFSLANEKISIQVSSALIWIIMFFGAMTSLHHAFINEVERNTELFTYMIAKPTYVFWGKLIYNIFLSLLLNIIAVALFLLFNDGLVIAEQLLFWVVILLASIGLAGISTIISAIIAKANSKNALFPILSFPILLPLILLGIEATVLSISGHKIETITGNINFIMGYIGAIVTVSYLLFDFVWYD